MGMSNIFNVSEIVEIIPITYNILDIKDAENSRIKYKIINVLYQLRNAKQTVHISLLNSFSKIPWSYKATFN